MTDRETPLAEIVGQMSLSKKHTDVSTQSWIFISVNDDLTCGTWQFCLHNDEPCGFVTFVCVSVATHVTARGVRVITIGNIVFGLQCARIGGH